MMEHIRCTACGLVLPGGPAGLDRMRAHLTESCNTFNPALGQTADRPEAGLRDETKRIAEFLLVRVIEAPHPDASEADTEGWMEATEGWTPDQVDDVMLELIKLLTQYVIDRNKF